MNYILRVSLAAFFFCLLADVVPGALDRSFNAAAYGALIGSVLVAERQADGKVVIGGAFSEINGHPATGLARLNADGSVDTSFEPPVFFGVGTAGVIITAIGVQSDGRIVIGGIFEGVTGDNLGRGIRRLNPDGSLDLSFNVLQIPGGDSVRDITIQADDKILIGGSTVSSGGMLVRMNVDGSVDGSFAPPNPVMSVFRIVVLTDGKILISGHGTIKRLTAAGQPDDTFANVDTNIATIADMAVRPDGKIVIVGAFVSLNGAAAGGIALLNANGTPDPTFNNNNVDGGANLHVSTVDLRPDGKIIIGGGFTTYNQVPRQRAARLNADGTLDTSFANIPVLVNTSIRDIAVLNDGRILLVNEQPNVPPAAVLVNSSGVLDITREYIASTGGHVRRVTPLSSGKMMIAGYFNYVNGVRRRGLARLNPDGSLDTSFVPYFNTDTFPVFGFTTVAEQPDGKIIVGGLGGYVLKRLNTDGSHDPTFAPPFDTNSSPYDVIVLPGGDILAAGSFWEGVNLKRIVRLSPTGVPQAFAAAQPNEPVYRVVLQPDGKFIIGGDFIQVGAIARGRIARLNTDGSLDTGFATGAGASGSVFNLLLQPDGKVIVGGSFPTLHGSFNHAKIGRLNSDGSLDAGFAQTLNGNVVGLALQTDGKVLVGGGFSAVGGNARSGLTRLNSNGTLDLAFQNNLINPVLDIVVQPNRSILIAGEFTSVNGQGRLRIAKILPNTALFDFDGDGRSDVSVYRPSTGTWFELFSSNGQVRRPAFGLNGDLPVPADYDGDGTTDEAIYRPSTGEFWYLGSAENAAVSVRWGSTGDVPRPSDFDGDGRADYVLWRPADATWYRLGSLGQMSIVQFGLADDQPLVGDFDGDGRSDVAVFRPSTGDWWYLASGSSNAIRHIHWGQDGDIPVPADFDADGKADLAVYRPSSGTWYVLNSTNQSFTIVPFGLSGDRPVAADYDGDGRADIAVFRPSTGIWYLLQTTSGQVGINWGISTDVALPSAFLP